MSRRRPRPRITYRDVTNPNIPVTIHPQDDGSLIIDVDTALHGRERARRIEEVLGPYLRDEVALLPMPLLAAGWAATADRWLHDHQWLSGATAATAAACVSAAAIGVLPGTGGRPAEGAAPPSPAIMSATARTAGRTDAPGPPSTRTAPRTGPPGTHAPSRARSPKPSHGLHEATTRDRPTRTWQPRPAPTAEAAAPSHTRATPSATPKATKKTVKAVKEAVKEAAKATKKAAKALAPVVDDLQSHGRGKDDGGLPVPAPTVDVTVGDGNPPPGPRQRVAAGCGVADPLDVCP